MNVNDPRVIRIERIVYNAIAESRRLEAMEDFEGANAVLCDAAAEHEKMFGKCLGGDRPEYKGY